MIVDFRFSEVRGPQVLTESPPELIREPDASPLSRLKSSAWAVGAAARFRTDIGSETASF